MIIIGGEGEYNEHELLMLKLKQAQKIPKKYQSKKKQGNNASNSNEEDIQVDLDPESETEFVSKYKVIFIRPRLTRRDKILKMDQMKNLKRKMKRRSLTIFGYMIHLLKDGLKYKLH